MLLRSISDPTWTLENFRRLASDSVFMVVFWTTLRTSLTVTVGALLLGYPVALAMSRLRGGYANLVLIVVLLPFWTSVLVRSWRVLVRDRSGQNWKMLHASWRRHCGPLETSRTESAMEASAGRYVSSS